MTKITALASCLAQPDNSFVARFAKQTEPGDGSDIVTDDWHILTFSPGCNVASLIGDANTQLITEGYPAITSSDQTLIEAQTSAAWTPSVVSAWQANHP